MHAAQVRYVEAEVLDLVEPAEVHLEMSVHFEQLDLIFASLSVRLPMSDQQPSRQGAPTAQLLCR